MRIELLLLLLQPTLCDLKVLILVVNTLQMRMRIITMAVNMSPYVLPTSTLVECFNQFACILK